MFLLTLQKDASHSFNSDFGKTISVSGNPEKNVLPFMGKGQVFLGGSVLHRAEDSDNCARHRKSTENFHFS